MQEAGEVGVLSGGDGPLLKSPASGGPMVGVTGGGYVVGGKWPGGPSVSLSLPQRTLASLSDADKADLLEKLRGLNSPEGPATVGHKMSLWGAEPGLLPAGAEPGLPPGVPAGSSPSGHAAADISIGRISTYSSSSLVKDNVAILSQAAFGREERGTALLPKPKPRGEPSRDTSASMSTSPESGDRVDGPGS